MQGKGRRADFEASRVRFLDAADHVYIANGYAGSTIRTISEQAGTSLARLNRHWEGKHHLFTEVFGRHFGTIHAAQTERLDEVEQRGLAGRELVGAIADAFLAPAYSSIGERGLIPMQVYCRAMVDPAPEARAIVEDLVSPLRSRLIALIRQGLPQHSEPHRFMIMSAMFGAYVYPQLFGRELAASMEITLSAADWRSGVGQIARLFRDGVGS